MNKEKHQAIIFPGLSDDVRAISWLTQSWGKYGVEPHIQKIGWHDNESLEEKLDRTCTFVDEIREKGPVSIIGTSAGGSFAFNVFELYKDKLEKAVSIYGRLRSGNYDNTFRSLERAAMGAPVFKQSVLRFEMVEKHLSKQNRQRLMTVHPRFGDEIVPSTTMSIDGAHDVATYIPEHILGIGFSLLFPQAILEFLLEKNISRD